MVEGKLKSGRFRKVFVKVPGNTIKIHYRKRKPQAARCAVYGTPLKGVPTSPRSVPKTQRRPERPFGGVLSSKAMREKMKEKARKLSL